MNGDLISRSEAITEIQMLPHNGDNISGEEAEQAIANLAPKNADEIRYVEFEQKGEVTFFDIIATPRVCTACNQEFIVLYDKPMVKTEFCPRCGARRKMDLKEDSICNTQ